MTSINMSLWELLGGVEQSGQFCTQGRVESSLPALSVKGVGRIALPLLPVQMEQLIQVSEQAPYGRGEETLVDTTVRRTWQINADQMTLEGKFWTKTVNRILDEVRETLHIRAGIEAELYKLLIYDTGSFFIRHRDTEKAPGMFATLVIALPSEYEGGALRIRHRNEEVCVNLAVSDPGELAYAAFYADCQHEVLPVTAGCRLTLIYNLIQTSATVSASPPDHQSVCQALSGLLQDWKKNLATPGDTSPDKFIYLLEHAYTPAGLSFAALKGRDRAIAEVLSAATQQAACKLYLALVTIEQTCNAEYLPQDDRYDHYEDDEEDYEAGEILEELMYLGDWRQPDGVIPAGLPEDLPFAEEELCTPEGIEAIDLAESSFNEATGNAGATIDRLYAKAALVFWPASHHLTVLCQGGAGAMVSYLQDQLQTWKDQGSVMGTEAWQNCHTVLKTLQRNGEPARVSSDSFKALLAVMVDLNDAEHFAVFLEKIACDDLPAGCIDTLVRGAPLLSPAHWCEQITRIVTQRREKRFDACVALLAELERSTTPTHRPDLPGLLDLLLAGMPSLKTEGKPGWNIKSIKAVTLITFMSLLLRHHARGADRLARHVLEEASALYPLDDAIVPLTVGLRQAFPVYDQPALQRLHQVSLEHLQTRMAEPLEPPTDLTRPAVIMCRCEHCQSLNRFLSEPDQSVWTMGSNEQSRRHVMDSIEACRADVSPVVERSPQQRNRYNLVCTKNQASYRRRVQQRKQDEVNLAALSG